MKLNLILFFLNYRQEWRRGIVEGEKTAINPILEWIFKDTESLKERAYLAKYLITVEVPGKIFHYSIIRITRHHCLRSAIKSICRLNFQRLSLIRSFWQKKKRFFFIIIVKLEK